MTSAATEPPMSRRPETWALVLLTIGAYTGPIGWIAGWVLTARSTRWTLGQKVLAALLPAVMLLGLVPVVLIAGQVGCGNDCDPGLPPIVVSPLLLVMLLVLGSMLTRLIRAARA